MCEARRGVCRGDSYHASFSPPLESWYTSRGAATGISPDPLSGDIALAPVRHQMPARARATRHASAPILNPEIQYLPDVRHVEDRELSARRGPSPGLRKSSPLRSTERCLSTTGTHLPGDRQRPLEVVRCLPRADGQSAASTAGPAHRRFRARCATGPDTPYQLPRCHQRGTCRRVGTKTVPRRCRRQRRPRCAQS